jgi:hypothetical protein
MVGGDRRRCQKVLCMVDGEHRLVGVVDRADLLPATGDALRGLVLVGPSDEVDEDA